MRRVVALAPPGAQMLELDSGPGHDALFFEAHGVHVRRTDGARAFVERLRASGQQADLLDVTTDEFGGPFDIVFANAVLLHLTVNQLDDVLPKAARAVAPEGLLAFTVKEGDGDAWTTGKISRPRHFTYWREPAMRTHLSAAGWKPASVTRVRGRSGPWLYFVCRRVLRLLSGLRSAALQSVHRSCAADRASLTLRHVATGNLCRLGTMRSDGFPRISPMEPRVLENQLWLGGRPVTKKSSRITALCEDTGFDRRVRDFDHFYAVDGHHSLEAKRARTGDGEALSSRDGSLPRELAAVDDA